MISAELEADIRRLFFAEHWKVGTIVTQLRSCSSHFLIGSRSASQARHASPRAPTRPGWIEATRAPMTSSSS